jgi:hypothetical protein
VNSPSAMRSDPCHLCIIVQTKSSKPKANRTLDFLSCLPIVCSLLSGGSGTSEPKSGGSFNFHSLQPPAGCFTIGQCVKALRPAGQVLTSVSSPTPVQNSELFLLLPLSDAFRVHPLAWTLVSLNAQTGGLWS